MRFLFGSVRIVVQSCSLLISISAELCRAKVAKLGISIIFATRNGIELLKAVRLRTATPVVTEY